MNKLRYMDYYNMTETLDNLYEKSKKNKPFKRLMNIITSKENILLAFRLIKNNVGSLTSGTDNKTISDLKDLTVDEIVSMVRNRLNNYKPEKVRRKLIDKEDGRKRPLGIPNIEDRLIQQCILNVLDPICEAKFHPHSYGFRANRNTKHAIARINHLINTSGLTYVVDVDIKSFFDNINHTKLIKQIYSLGIHDRKLLSIIRAILHSEIDGEGIPIKGTPQGGIISPILANIALNELDWWIENQWNSFPTRYNYSNRDKKVRALKNRSNLKEVYIVRYADDFKLVCRNYNTAKRIFMAVRLWLKERLKLEVNEEKSRIVNTKKNSTKFLGYEIKAVRKGTSRKGVVAHSYVQKKCITKMLKKARGQIKKIYHNPIPNNVQQYNSMILGWHEYYKGATHVCVAFREINYKLRRLMYNRFSQGIGKEKIPDKTNSTYQKLYGDSTAKTWNVAGIQIFPMHYIKNKPIMNFSQVICDYTPKGRERSTKALKTITLPEIKQLMKQYDKSRSVQYNDNRLSKASAVKMRCEVTGIRLTPNVLHCHHQIPISMGGTDEYKNLKIVHEEVHYLIHATTKETISKYIHLIEGKKKRLNKLNKLREYCSLTPIDLKDYPNEMAK